MSRVRLATRLARRELRRHPWRTLLAVLIMALPVMALQIGILFAHAQHAAQQTRDAMSFDGADYAAYVAPTDTANSGLHDPIFAQLPKPERTLETFHFRDWLVTSSEGALEPVDAIGNVPNSPRIHLVTGRLPTTVNETALNARAMRAAHVQIGDRVELAHGDVQLRVVGEADVRDQTDGAAMIVGRAGSVDSAWLDRLIAQPLSTPRIAVGGARRVLVWFAPHSNWQHALSVAEERSRPGDVVSVPANTAARNATIAVVTGGGIGILAVIASVAFTIGSRRRLRALGLLASSGAAPADIRATVLIEGVLCGLIAAIDGTVLVGLGWSTIGRTHWADHLISSNLADPPHPFAVVPVVAVALLCVIVGTLAAFWPARTAARTSVLTALAGRRPLPRLRARLPMLGLITFGVGTAVIAENAAQVSHGDAPATWILALAGLGVVCGGVVIAPALVVIVGKLGAKFRGTGRLAARGIARDRTRYAAVIGATAVAVAVAALSQVNLAREVHRSSLTAPTYGLVTIQGAKQDVPRSIANVKAIIGDDVVVARSVTVPGDTAKQGTFYTAGGLLVVDPTAVARWLPKSGIAEKLRSGRLVDLRFGSRDCCGPEGPSLQGEFPPSPGFYRSGKQPPVDVVDISAHRLAEHPELKRLYVPPDAPLLAAPDVLAPGQLNRWGEAAYVLRARPITSSENADLEEIRQGDVPTLAQVRSAVHNSDATGHAVELESGSYVFSNYDGPSHQATLLAVAVVASGVFTLLIVLVALALAAADGRDDEALFAAIGAPPALLRRRRTIEAALLGVAGSLLGVLIGAIPAWASLHAQAPSATPLGFDARPPGYDAVPIPLVQLALLILGVTVFVTVVVWCGLAAKDLLASAARTRRPLVLVRADA